jgi:hypothetical protein
MRRMIKILVVATLVAVILVASVSPALARVIRGGVLLQTTNPCSATANAQNAPGSHLLDPAPGRAPGCWVVLPPSATKND